jgi:NAD(P)-dependent dehydrogenase (short-subunit alcohol dehydrogenase family)
MAVAVITGSAGLIGAEAARFFADKGLEIVGIDNDMRRQFFGEEASTAWNRNASKARSRLTGTMTWISAIGARWRISSSDMARA